MATCNCCDGLRDCIYCGRKMRYPAKWIPPYELWMAYFANSQQSIDPEFVDIVNEHFWECM